jgi:hypothetical protein
MDWHFHPDKAVDVAVAEWFPEDEQVAHEPIPSTMIMPADPLTTGGGRPGIGDEVIIAGLFTRFHGIRRNWPIVRIGNLAMAPDEKHKTALGDAYMYLVETRSIGGLKRFACIYKRNSLYPS